MPANFGATARQGACSRAHWSCSSTSGNRERPETHARQAIELLERRGNSPELAMAYSNRSQLAMLAGDTETTLAFGEKALQLARTLGQHDIESHALNNIGGVQLSTGDQRGEESLLQALQIALDHDLHEHAALAYVNLASSGTVNNDVTARRYLEQGLAYCEQRDLDSWSTYLRVFLARFALGRGAWDEAAEAFHAHEMPYHEALTLLRSGRPGIQRASMILQRLGASRLLASSRRTA